MHTESLIQTSDICHIRDMIVAGTGHRPDKLGGYAGWSIVQAKLALSLVELFNVHRPSRIISGLAQGWDTVMALAAIECEIPLEVHIPCRTQSDRWPPAAQELWTKLFNIADVRVVISDQYTHYCMDARNRSMVDRANTMLACHSGASGGTQNCINYAVKNNVPVINLYTQMRQVARGE